MNGRESRWRVAGGAVAALMVLLGGCDSGDDGLSNGDPGDNDVNTVVAFGDSITEGGQCSCMPYPARLAGLVGKTVYNTGIGGSCACENVDRTRNVIARYHPGFMFILYGVNDVIHGGSLDSMLGAVDQMVKICQENHVVPVLMTYPIPIEGHRIFATNTRRLNRGIIEIAKADGVRYVDLEREFSTGEHDPNEPEWTVPNPDLYEPDGLHPNDAGTQIIALACADPF